MNQPLTDTREGHAGRILLAGVLAGVILAMFPITQDSTGPVKWLALSWGGVALALYLTAAAWTGGLSACRPRAFLTPGALLLALFAVAAVTSDYPAHSLELVRRLAAVALVYVAAAQLIRTPEQARRVFAVVLAATALASLYGLGQRAGVDPFPWAYDPGLLYDGLPGTLGNPNYAAHLLVLAIPMTLFAGSAGGRWRWMLLLVLLFGAHLAATGQRAGVVALAASGVLLLIARGLRAMRPAAAVVATLAVFLVTCTLAAATGMAYFNATTGLPVPLDESLLVRYNGYASTARMVHDRPLLGFGPGVFVIENTRYWTPYEQQRFAAEQEMNAHAHNEPLEFAVDAGLGASFLYLFLLVGGATNALFLAFSSHDPATRRLGWACAAACCAFGIDGLFGFNARVPASASVFALLLGTLDGAMPAGPGSSGRMRLGGKLALTAAAAAALLIAAGTTRHFLAEALYSASVQAAKRGETVDAERRLESATGLAPASWVYPAELGLARLARNDTQAAIALFREALTRNPNYFLALVNLASTRLQAERAQDAADPGAMFDAAREHVEHALTLCPVLPEALELRGRIHLAEADRASHEHEAAALLDMAESDFRQALANGSKNPFGLYLRVARIRADKGDVAGAERFLARAVEEEPGSERVWEVYFRLASETGRFAGMQEALFYTLQDLGQRGPGDTATRALLTRWFGIVKEAVGELDEAERLFQQAIELAPKRIASWEAYAAYGRRHGREALVRTHLAKAAAHFHALGAPAPAFEAVHQALNEPGDGPLRGAGILRDGLAYTGGESSISPTELEDLAWAAGWVETALPPPAQSYDAALAWCTLGRVHTEAGNASSAVRCFDAGMPHAPPGFQVQFAPAWAKALAATGDSERAAAVLREAVAAEPGNVVVRLALARVLADHGNVEEAARHYEYVLGTSELPVTERPQVAHELETLRNGQTGP